MSDSLQQRRPRLAYPFTILTGADTVRLVAGEDFRYTLTAPELDRWLPPLLERFIGKEMLHDLLAPLTSTQRESALQVIQHLYGERVLVDGTANDAHDARRYHVVVEGAFLPSPGSPGEGAGVRAGQSATDCTPLTRPSPGVPGEGSNPTLIILCQDRLDYVEALRCNRRCRDAKTPWLWVSTGPLTRAYVSPLFLPDAGPCFGCLLRSFHRLSPAPEIYDALRDHAEQGKPIASVEFPPEGLDVLGGIVRWKLRQAELELPDPALYRLHVLEREHFEISTHRVFADPLCPECGREGA